MKLILGAIIVFSCVLGGFMIGKGQILSLWQPNEILIICGAAFGAFIISNPVKTILATFQNVGRLLIGHKFHKALYLELFSLLYYLGAKYRKGGAMSIENDIESPETSSIFQEFPTVLSQKRLVDFICDNFRVIISSKLSSHELEGLLEHELQTIEDELGKPAHAVSVISDALPGFGVVAAVMGIVITMQFLGGDQQVLGMKISAALVGTFLGVLLSYGLIGPIGLSMEHQIEKELAAYQCVKIFLTAFISGAAPIMGLEHARRALFSDVKPSFTELEEHLMES